MAEEPTTTTPPAANTPAAAAAPARTEPPKTNGKPPKKPASKMVTFVDKKGREMSMPENAFQARLNREAAAMVRQRLGVSLEEAEKLVKAGGSTPAPPAGTTPTAAASAVADEAIRQLQNRNAQLQRSVERERRRADEEAKKRQKEVQRLKDQQAAAEVRAAASAAGIHDTAYALHLFATAAAADKADDPAAFFAGLKKTHAHLFTAPKPPEPQVVDQPASTAPPESQQPGEDKPRESTPSNGGGAGGKNVDEMSPQEFAAHQRSYGFRPGA